MEDIFLSKTIENHQSKVMTLSFLGLSHQKSQVSSNKKSLTALCA